MVCNNCGKEIENGTKFCSTCGTKVEEKVAPVEEKKEEKVVEPVVTETAKPASQGSSALGIVSMVLGIVSIILSWILSIFILVVPIAGLILGICAKGKKGFKITGIILNAISIAVCVIMFFAGLSALGQGLKEAGTEIEKGLKEVGTTVKSGYPYGTWTCVSYDSGSLYSYDYENIKNNSIDDLTVLTLNTDNTYQYGPKKDAYKNYYKGTFTYEIETDKNNDSHNISNGYKFIMVKGPITDAMIDGVKKETTAENRIELEMELFRDYDYDKALIMFTSSYNMYMCER